MLDNNFGKCGPIYKILSPIDLRENSLYVPQRFPLCCYTTLWKSKSRNVTDFDSILNKLLTCTWGHFEHLI